MKSPAPEDPTPENSAPQELARELAQEGQGRPGPDDSSTKNRPPAGGQTPSPASPASQGAREMPLLDVEPPIIVGVLGGIASGKSWVARALAGRQGIVLDADQAAHKALQDPEIQAKIAERFGSEAIGEDGQTDRAVLAKVVFADPGARADLEGWIHPAVRATLSAALEDAERRAVPRVVLDVPLLLENADVHGLLARCHLLVFVDAPLEDRDRRAVHDRGWTPGEVARREAAQMPLAEKRAHAHVVIDNRGDLKTLEANVQDVLARLPKAHAPTAEPRPPRNQD